MRRSEQTGHTVKLLHIDSSILDGNSASRALTAGIVARWRRAMPELQVLHRDLAGTHALSHLDGASLAKSDAAEAARSDRVMEDFLAADVIVLGAPMYNFGIPSQLKAWIDRIAVAGKTFRYTAEGPQGLAGSKQVFVAATYGGMHPVDSGRNFGIAFRKEDAAFRSQVEGALECIKADGTLAKIHEKWFGVKPDAGSSSAKVYPGTGAPDFEGYDATERKAACK